MVELEELEDGQRKDFRRVQGAPMVRRLDDPTKWVRYSRPSGWGDDLDDEAALTLWKIDRACDGVASSPALAAKVAAVKGLKTGRKDLREEAIKLGKGDEAADMGNALHAMSHRVETEPGFKAPEPFASDLAAYLSAIDQAGLESTHFECHVCADRWRAAGTPDRIWRSIRELTMPDGHICLPGTSFIGDLKTGARLTYSLPGFAIQMALYCDGMFYDVETDERTPMPPSLNTAWGILAHLPVGQAKCELLWVDLQVGRVGAELVQQVRAWRKREDFAEPFTMPDSDELAVLASGIHELEQTRIEAEHTPFAEEAWLEAMLPWAQDRIRAIGRLSDPRALLLRRWPDGVAPFTVAAPSQRQLTQILDLLTDIESAFNLPFPEGDPRVEWDRGLHRSEVIRDNEPRDKGSRDHE